MSEMNLTSPEIGGPLNFTDRQRNKEPNFEITDQAKFTRVVSDVQQKVREKYGYTMPLEEAQKIASGKNTKINVRMPTMKRIDLMGRLTGMVNGEKTWERQVDERTLAVQEGNLAVQEGNLAVQEGNLGDAQARTKIAQDAQDLAQAEALGFIRDQEFSAQDFGIDLSNIQAGGPSDAEARATITKGFKTATGMELNSNQLQQIMDGGTLTTLVQTTAGRGAEVAEGRAETERTISMAELTGELENGNPILRLRLANMDDKRAREMWGGWTEPIFAEDGVTKVGERRITGQGELQKILQDDQQMFESMAQTGFDFVDDFGIRRHFMGAEELADMEFDFQDKINNGWNSPVYASDGKTVIGVKHHWGANEIAKYQIDESTGVSDRQIDLEREGMTKADARFYAELEQDWLSVQGYEGQAVSISYDAEGNRVVTPQLDEDGQPIAVHVYGTSEIAAMPIELERDKLTGFTYMDDGVQKRVYGSQEWAQMVTDDDQEWRTVMEWGGEIAFPKTNADGSPVLDEEGNPVIEVYQIEGTQAHDSNERALDRSLTKLGWKLEAREEFRRWERDQKELWGYRRLNEKGEMEWVEGTLKFEERMTGELQDDQQEHLAAMQEDDQAHEIQREYITWNRTMFLERMRQKFTREQWEKEATQAQIQLDWQAEQRKLDRQLQADLADKDFDVQKWKQKQQNRTVLYTGIIELGAEIAIDKFLDDPVDFGDTLSVIGSGSATFWKTRYGYGDQEAESMAAYVRQSKPYADVQKEANPDWTLETDAREVAYRGKVTTPPPTPPPEDKGGGTGTGTGAGGDGDDDDTGIGGDGDTSTTEIEIEDGTYSAKTFTRDGGTEYAFFEEDGKKLRAAKQEDGTWKIEGQDPETGKYTVEKDSDVYSYDEAGQKLVVKNSVPGVDAGPGGVRDFGGVTKGDALKATMAFLGAYSTGQAQGSGQQGGFFAYATTMAEILGVGASMGLGQAFAAMSAGNAAAAAALEAAAGSMGHPVILVAYAAGKMLGLIKGGKAARKQTQEWIGQQGAGITSTRMVDQFIQQLGMTNDEFMVNDNGHRLASSSEFDSVFFDLDTGFNDDDAKPGEVAKPRVIFYKKKGSTLQAGISTYQALTSGEDSGLDMKSIPMDEFFNKTGLTLMPLLGNEAEIYEAMPAEAQKKFFEAEFKPSYALAWPDGATTYFDRKNSKQVYFSAEEVTEIFGGRAAGAEPPADIGGADERGVPNLDNMMTEAAMASGLSRSALGSLLATLTDTRKGEALRRVINGRRFAAADADSIFGVRGPARTRFDALVDDGTFILDDDDQIGG